MHQESKRNSLLKAVGLLFILVYFIAELYEQRYARIVAGIESMLLFGMVAVVHRLAPRELGKRFVLGAGLPVVAAEAVGTLGDTHGTIRGVLVAAAAILLAVGLWRSWRHVRRHRAGSTDGDAAPE